MTWRVTEDEVREVVSSDATISVAPFIRLATNLTDKVAAQDDSSDLDNDTLKNIELMLSAHFYSLRDQQYASRSTGRASATFQGQTGMKLDSTGYGQTAQILDTTGYLARLNRGVNQVRAIWLGKTESEQTPYEERN